MDDRNKYFGNENYGVIVEFLRGQRADWDGRWLREIRTWDYDRLEEDHQYIQWLFPLTTESEAVFAPMLRQFEVPSLREDPQLRQTLVASLCQMLAFYGYDLRWEGDKCMVAPSEQHSQRARVWMTPENHNYRRISRILGALMLARLESHARAFLEALERLYDTPDGAAGIDQLAMWYWRHQFPPNEQSPP